MPAGSRGVCIYDDASVRENTAKSDVESALSSLGCTVLWREGVRGIPEYDDLVSSLPPLRSFEPDFLVAIGGGSTIDSAKFLSWAINLLHGKDPSKCMHHGKYPSATIPVVTLLASGSWWNPIFGLKRRATVIPTESYRKTDDGAAFRQRGPERVEQEAPHTG
jgi:NADP-dependent alcohol dehydrogenase